MDLKDIASVTGKPGLFKIIKPTRNGVILETIDAQKLKIVINTNSKVSILKDVSVYTTGAETNKPLSDILQLIKEKFGDKVDVSSKSDDKQLRDFFVKIVPDYDEERVYTSDIRKIISWYSIILQNYPELLLPQSEEVTSEETSKTKEETKPKKTSKKEGALDKASEISVDTDVKPVQKTKKTAEKPASATKADKAVSNPDAKPAPKAKKAATK
ncbi:MAG: DUF5606 domain-containing protein [Bacteroidota bacterium]|nr:DUF5606 domain-containing protein [Bacteroidota bacterium]